MSPYAKKAIQQRTEVADRVIAQLEQQVMDTCKELDDMKEELYRQRAVRDALIKDLPREEWI